MTFSKSNSIANINIDKDHNMKHTLHRGRRIFDKCQSVSNINMNEITSDDFVEEMTEIKLQQSASLQYNSVIEELKARASPRRINT